MTAGRPEDDRQSAGDKRAAASGRSGGPARGNWVSSVLFATAGMQVRT